MSAAYLLAALAASLPVPHAQVALAINAAIDPKRGPINGPLVMRVELFADPKGKVIDCAVRAFTGSDSNAKAVCKAAMNKKVKPAADFAGAASYGLTVFNIRVGDGSGPAGLKALPQVPSSADVVLQISQYPTGYDRPVRIGLIIEAAPDGTIAHCSPNGITPAALAGPACEHLKSAKMPLRHDKGVAVSYVSPFEVEFTTEALAPA